MLAKRFEEGRQSFRTGREVRACRCSFGFGAGGLCHVDGREVGEGMVEVWEVLKIIPINGKRRETIL